MTNIRAAISTALLRAEVDAVLADWAWHLDHGDYDALAELFTEDALFVTGSVELRGRSAIKNRYTERVVARSTRHTYSGLRVSPEAGDPSATADGRPATVRTRSTCPDPRCCRLPAREPAERWADRSWPSAVVHTQILAPLPTGTFPGVDENDVYAFLDRHSGS